MLRWLKTVVVSDTQKVTHDVSGGGQEDGAQIPYFFGGFAVDMSLSDPDPRVRTF